MARPLLYLTGDSIAKRGIQMMTWMLATGGLIVVYFKVRRWRKAQAMAKTA